MRRMLTVVALAVAAGCSGSSSTPSGDADAGANSQSGMTYGCQLEEADNCFCSNGNAPTTGTCNTQSVIGAVAAGGASCCKFNDVSNSCSCWAFICDNYASGLSTTDCSCGWFGPTHPQTSCTGTYCCAIPASGFGANAEPGVCHCGDTPCSPGQTQVAQCDSTTTPPNCPPGATEVMACD